MVNSAYVIFCKNRFAKKKWGKIEPLLKNLPVMLKPYEYTCVHFYPKDNPLINPDIYICEIGVKDTTHKSWCASRKEIKRIQKEIKESIQKGKFKLVPFKED